MLQHSIPGAADSHPDLSILRTPMDLVIVRENTEGFYSDRNVYAGSGEFMPDENSAFSIRKIAAAGPATSARPPSFRLKGNQERQAWSHPGSPAPGVP